MAPQKKISVAEAQQWLKNLDQSKTRGLSSGDEETWLEFINGLRPVDFVEPKKTRKPRVSKKKSSGASDRSEEGYDCMRCDARASKKQKGLRFDFQCSHKKLEGECFCKNHLKQFNSEKGLELGKYNEERPDKWSDGKPIVWHDADPEVLTELKKSTKKKKEKTDAGDKKSKKCGLCGGFGHNRRKCPSLEKTPEEPTELNDGDTYEENGIVNQVCIQKHIKPDGTECEVEIHTPVDLCQVCPEPIPENEAEAARLDRIAKLEAAPETEPETDLKLTPQLPDDNGVGVGLKPLEFDDSVTEDMSDDSSDSEEEEEDEENIPFLYQGVPYEREPNGDKTVFDDDGETIGTWNGESIDFIGGVEERQHKKRVAELGGSTPQSSTTEDLLALAVSDLRKMAKSLNISQDDIDSAFDRASDAGKNPKGEIIQLIRSA